MDKQGMLLRPMVTSTARVVEYGKNRTVIVAAIETEGNRMIPEKTIKKQPKKEYNAAHVLRFFYKKKLSQFKKKCFTVLFK